MAPYGQKGTHNYVIVQRSLRTTMYFPTAKQMKAAGSGAFKCGVAASLLHTASRRRQHFQIDIPRDINTEAFFAVLNKSLLITIDISGLLLYSMASAIGTCAHETSETTQGQALDGSQRTREPIRALFLRCTGTEVEILLLVLGLHTCHPIALPPARLPDLEGRCAVLWEVSADRNSRAGKPLLVAGEGLRSAFEESLRDSKFASTVQAQACLVGHRKGWQPDAFLGHWNAS
jgi:hypothetical protein